MLSSADLVGPFVVAGVRIGSGIMVPGHGTVLNYPGRFAPAHIDALLAAGHTFVSSNAIAPEVSVHSYETHLPSQTPVHMTDDWEDERVSSDILGTPVPEAVIVEERESVAVKKVVTPKPAAK